MANDSSRTGYVRTLASRIRIGKFVTVGAVGALIDVTVLVFLVEAMDVLEEVAMLVGIEVSIVVMFVLNDRWTFDSSGAYTDRSRVGRLVRSHVVRSGGILTQFLVFVLVYRLLAVSIDLWGVDLWLLVAKAIGIAVGLVVNYVFESLYTWNVHLDR